MSQDLEPNPVSLDEALNTIQNDLFAKSNLTYTYLVIDKESKNYNACTFVLNLPSPKKVIFRTAKITPTKIGQFVTLWKRDGIKFVITPFDISDDFDLIVIFTQSDQNKGFFIFDKEILLKKDIIAESNDAGKCAIRVYPPWDIAENKQAISTQRWQAPYFININNYNNFLDFMLALH